MYTEFDVDLRDALKDLLNEMKLQLADLQAGGAKELEQFAIVLRVSPSPTGSMVETKSLQEDGELQLYIAEKYDGSDYLEEARNRVEEKQAARDEFSDIIYNVDPEHTPFTEESPPEASGTPRPPSTCAKCDNPRPGEHYNWCELADPA